jgi:CRP-like cAMP-binding protein
LASLLLPDRASPAQEILVAGFQTRHSTAVLPPRNDLLAALPPEDLGRIWPQLERVELAPRQILPARNVPLSEVHFPEVGWLSMVAVLPDGGTAEVAQCGRDGMLGLPLLFGREAGSLTGLVQAAGTALRMDAAAFLEALDWSPAFKALLLRYALAFQEEVAQTAACNGRHVLEQRLARWLMMAHERSGAAGCSVTHEVLAMMLCVRRSAVTITARQFQQAGLISYGKGHVVVTDPAGLEAFACACCRASRHRWQNGMATPAPEGV